MKKLIKISIFLIILLFAVDFIPVKFAIDVSDDNIESGYLCYHEQVTGGNWRVENTDKQLYFDNLTGNSPFNYLSKIYSTDYIEPSGNRYVLYGTIMPKENDIFDLNVEHWNIVYPVSRKSIRALYVPKRYLTLYDFNLIKLLKNMLSK